MKKWLIIFALLGSAYAQSGNVVLIPFAGVPTGTCSNIMLGLNTSNGNLYTCNSGAWFLAGAGGTAAFSGLTSGTNTGAAMVIGSGASLVTSGTGSNQATSLISGTTNPASAGIVRLAKSDALNFRNNANGADVNGISLNASDQPVIGGSAGVVVGSGTPYVGGTPGVPITTAAGQGAIQLSSTGNRWCYSYNAGSCFNVALSTDNLGFFAAGGAISVTGVTTTGSGAGYFQCTQGTAQGHATASTYTKECPASVTAYEDVVPGAAATGIMHWSNASSVVTESVAAVNLANSDVTGQLPIGNVGSAGLSGTSPATISAAGAIGCATCVTASSPGAGIAHFAGSTQAVTSSAVSMTADVTGILPPANGGAAVSFLTSLYTNATTTMSSVTGLSFSVVANKNYRVQCNLDYQTTATPADIKIQWTGPASPTFLVYDLDTAVTASSLSASVNPATATTTGAFSTVLSEAGTPTINTNFPLTLTMTLINGVNAGTLQLQAAATGVGTISVLPGSCEMLQSN